MFGRNKKSRSWRLGLAVGIFCGLGCGVKTYPVSGTVVFTDGKPATELAAGFVSFRSLDDPNNPSAQAVIKPDATFQARTFTKDDGLVPGKHQVAITPPPYSGREDKVLPPPALDSRFMKFETSGLEITIEKPTNDLKLTVDRFKTR